MARFLQIKVQFWLHYSAIAVQTLLALWLSQGAECMAKTSCAGIAVQILLAPDHESRCRNVFEGTWSSFTAYRTAIKLYLEQNASFAKTVTKK
jgi:hypothetical protein